MILSFALSLFGCMYIFAFHIVFVWLLFLFSSENSHGLFQFGKENIKKRDATRCERNSVRTKTMNNNNETQLLNSHLLFSKISVTQSVMLSTSFIVIAFPRPLSTLCLLTFCPPFFFCMNVQNHFIILVLKSLALNTKVESSTKNRATIQLTQIARSFKPLVEDWVKAVGTDEMGIATINVNQYQQHHK